jgi:glycosyltransferase involved in cell wall biosynthesis
VQKILYVIDQKPDGYPGGIEYHMLDLIRGFASRTLPVYVLFPEREGIFLRLYKDYRTEEKRYGGKSLDDHRLQDAEIEEVFIKILAEIDVDIVHFQSIRTMPLSLIELAKQMDKKVLMTLHEYYFWCINCIMLAPDFCWFEKDENRCSTCLGMSNFKVEGGYVGERRNYLNYLFSLIDMVVVPSLYVKDICMSLYDGLSGDRCIVLEHGIDKNLLKGDKKGKKSSPDGMLKLAFLGNFLHYKGNKAFLEIVKHYKNSDSVFFSIVGNIFDPSLIPSYSNLNAIGGYTRDNVVNSIHHADPDIILLLSNWPETFSYTLSEAIASATPVITTDGGALRERVSRHGVGFLVPVESPVPRTIEIMEDIKENPEVIEYLNGKVWEARKALKTIDEMIEETFKIYESLK